MLTLFSTGEDEKFGEKREKGMKGERGERSMIEIGVQRKKLSSYVIFYLVSQTGIYK